MGKGDRRYLDRTAISPSEMELRWIIAFGAEEEKAWAEAELAKLKGQDDEL